MSNHCGYVVKVEKLRKHPNADKLQILTVFGIDTCVGLDVVKGEIGVYFPSDLQLDIEFCDVNHLCRKTANGEPDTGYLDRDKRNVTSIKLRGEKSDGLFLPISCLEYTGVDMDLLNVGTTITDVNGHHICEKYIPKRKHQKTSSDKVNKTRKKKVPIAPLFAEHADTEQLAYNMDQFHLGDMIEVTLKMHGTSQRTGYLPRLVGWKPNNPLAALGMKYIDAHEHLNKFQKKLADYAASHSHPIYDWGYVTGTRRVVLNDFNGAGFYDTNNFREGPAKEFEGKLHKGETVYYEVVGYTETGVPIMGDCNNKKLNDKDFVREYGETTRFSYGCDEGFCDFYVYRMTMTNEDGDVVEYTPDFMRYRCEQMGIKTVPKFWTGIITDNYLAKTVDFETMEEVVRTPGEFVRELAECYYDGPDPVGKSHVREGVVVRIINRPSFTAYKHKNWYFKALEGIVKVEADAPDMEEAQEEFRDDAN